MKKLLGMLIMVAVMAAMCVSASAYEAVPKSKELALINQGYNVVAMNEADQPARKTFFKNGRVETKVIVKRWVRLVKASGSDTGKSTTNLGGGWSETVSSGSSAEKVIELVMYYVKTTKPIMVPSDKVIKVPVNLNDVQPAPQPTAKER